MGQLDYQWYSMEVEDVLNALNSSLEGLSDEEVSLRLRNYGYNEFEKRIRASPLRIFLLQFKNVFMLILIVAIAVSLVSGWLEAEFAGEPYTALETYADALVISAIVFLNAVVGFIQEYRSEKAIEALEKMAAPRARVLRNGREVLIPAREVVPGDVLILETGDRVPADARIIESVELRINEAVLTGESLPVSKSTEMLSGNIPVAERRNMVFAATHVVYGRGRAVVVATGMNTEFGKIAKMVQTVEKEEIPFRVKLDEFAKKIGLMVVSAAFLILLFEFIRNHIVGIEIFMTSVALAVSAVPEGLPAIVTVTLAIGARELARRNAVIRRLASAETLGSTTVICSDKTGTLTKGEMTVRQIFVNKQRIEVTGSGYSTRGEFYRDGKQINPAEENETRFLLMCSTLCSNASFNGNTIVGDPTEGALIVAAAKAGIRKVDVESEYPRVGEIPFSSERKRMTTIHKSPDGRYIAITKGSPETVLQLCNRLYYDGGEVKLARSDRDLISRENEEMAGQALRVLAVAYKVLPNANGGYAEDNVERDMVFVGLAGMIDPPREEAKESVRLCRKAGIKVVMITGDHKLTAIAIAREIGIYKEGDLALTGAELDNITEEDFEEIVEKVTVYARVSPEHKLRIVKALKIKGNIVAMTGDGVNDAPALKQADIGVAMGVTGTDVAKEASDMILADDNFATIVKAVEGGRMIYSNIRKFIRFLLALNFTELILVGSFALAGLPIPLLPTMILWLNLVTDGPPAIALSKDPPAEDVMEKPPRNPKQGLLHGMSFFIFASTIIQLTAEVTVFWWGYTILGSLEKARTMVFLVACFFELVVVWNCRSESRNAFKVGFLNNKWLLAGVLISILSTLAVIYVPVLRLLFNTVQLNWLEWAIVAFFSCWGFLLMPEIFMRNTIKLKN
ncbi:MAG: calcium-translocating P-type ATPase, PMCA-type [Candidatus Bathyarchaeia archaeon]